MMKDVLFIKLNRIRGAIVLLLVALSFNAFAQTSITGHVAAAQDGTPLPGVTVHIKGTQMGTVTDARGNYRLSATPGSVLVFTYVGYLQQSITVGSGNVYNVNLSPDARTLTEVNVVEIGYGTARRGNVNGAVSSVSAATLESMPVTSTDQALQGRAAGVQVTNNDGSPGGNVSILIRGTGSLASFGNSPLYVVDGYPIDAGGINNINPNDIATIDILKDAASTAIYGIRAANGVILITTKRGRKNGVTVSADAYNEFQSKPKEYKVLNADQFATLANQQAAVPGSGFSTFSGWSNPASLHNIDWQNAVYRNGQTQNYDVALRGGTDKLQAVVSLAYYSQNGIVLDSYFHRVTLNSNMDAQPTTWLKSSTNVKYTYSQSNNPFGTGSLIQLGELPPTLDGGNKVTNQVKDAQGNYGFFNPIYTDILSYANPVYSIENNRNYPSNNFILANSSLEATILPGLKFKINGGVNANFYESIYDQPTDLRENTQYGQSAKINYGYYSQTMSQSVDWLMENTLAYDRTFGKHTINFVGGFSGQKTIWDGMGGSGIPPNNTVQDLSQVSTLELTANNPVGSDTGNGQNVTTLSSEFARLGYTYDDRYLLTGVIRRDGSSKFDTQNQYGTFPSGAFTWRAKNESFLKSVSWLSDLKLRATYGETGNQGPINPFQYQELFAGNRPASFNPGGIGTADDNLGYPFNKLYQNGYAALQPANPSLKWETDTQADAGIDASFLNGDLNITADYYDRKSKNFLLNIEVPAQTGYQFLTKNVGSMENSGLELSIDYHHNISKDFRFGALLTFSTQANKLTSITSGTNEISNFGGLATLADGWNPFSETFIGQPVGEFYGYKSLGIFQTQAQIDALNAKAPGGVYQVGTGPNGSAVPGNRYFADVNGDGHVTPADETSLGSPIPKFFGGLNLTASYKSWDFVAYFYGVYGNKIFNFQESQLESFQNRNFVGIQNISEQYYENAWTPQNHSNTYAAITTNDNVTGSNAASSAYIENGSYLKLKNFTVGYTLSQDFAKKIAVSKVRVYVSSQNLFTITSYKGLDPEIGMQNGNATQNGIDIGNYPSSRYLTVGINATF